MTTEQIHANVRQQDFPSTAIFSATPNFLIVKPRKLDFVYVLLENQRAVAVQQGNYVAFTTGMEFRPIRTLCDNLQISGGDLWDYERRRAAAGRQSQPPPI